MKPSRKMARLAGAFALALGATGCYQTGEGETTLELSGGKVTEENGPGWHALVPIMDSTVTYPTGSVIEVPLTGLEVYYSPDVTATAPAEEKTDAAENAEADTTTAAQDNSTGESTDAEEINTQNIADANAQQYTTHKATIRATVNKEHVTAIHGKYHSVEKIQRLLVDMGTEAYKSVVRKIDPLKINTKRDEIGIEATALLQKKLDRETGIPNSIIVSSVAFVDFDFEAGVKSSFETANEERAGIQAEQYKRQKAQIRIQTQSMEGQADAARIIAAAEGRAQAAEKEGQQLRKYPEVLQIRAIEAWEKGGSKVPATYVNSGGDNGKAVVPFLPVGPAPK
ncbi:MAG: SPFH domain-containing protein [Alphaproteobacteria bacterium]|nr:SPFH domain-containing protein [Alphaproteobacteria bacterium]